MTDQPKDSDWLNKILDDWEFKVTGIPKHWEKTPERNTIDERRNQAILTHIKREVLLGKIEEVAEARNAWHGTTDKEFADEMNDRLAELEQQLKQPEEVSNND